MANARFRLRACQSETRAWFWPFSKYAWPVVVHNSPPSPCLPATLVNLETRRSQLGIERMLSPRMPSACRDRYSG